MANPSADEQPRQHGSRAPSDAHTKPIDKRDGHDCAVNQTCPTTEQK